VQLGQDAAGGALRGGRWIVQLVGEVAGELAEGGEFFALLLDAGDFADAVEESGDDALAIEGMASSISGKRICGRGWPRRLGGEALAAVLVMRE
jgi:hypothetical protein